MLTDAEGARLYPASLSNADFVTAVFKRALGRSPSGTELSQFSGQLATRTRGQVVSAIIDATVAYLGTDRLQQASQTGFAAKVSTALAQLAAQAQA